MEGEDPLEWLWNGILDFKEKFNNLFIRAMLDFKRPFDITRHDPECELRLIQASAISSCTCCKGALTFEEAIHVKGNVTRIRAGQATKDRDFNRISWKACQGIENWKDLLGLQNDKESISAMFGIDEGNGRANLIFRKSGIIARTLDHWKEIITEASALNLKLQAELLKLRDELFNARAETKRAEEREDIANLKLAQEKERLKKMQEAFAKAEKIRRIQAMKARFSSALLARSQNKSPMERLRAHRCTTKKATDSGKLSRGSIGAETKRWAL